MTDIPTVMSAAGLVPQQPADLRAQLVAIVAAQNPGYTADLPGALIEDIASTDTGALVVCDQARVELVNSLTPYGANLFLLNQLGQIYIGQGFRQGSASNTSVLVTFSGTPGFFVPRGFVVADSVHQYIVQDNAVVSGDGTTPLVFALAAQSGSWAVPSNTVTTVVTSVPSGVTLAVTNAQPGTPGAAAQSVADYRAEVIQAGLAAAQGFATFLKTQLAQVPGVQPRLIGVQQQTAPGGGWKVLVGGGDPYAVANAILEGVFDISTLVGSVISVTGVSNANPAVVTTDLDHGLATGQNNVHISGVVGMTAINGGPYTVTVIDEHSFSLNGVNSSGYPAYVSGGVVTPNSRNVTVQIQDYPDIYQIEYVSPPAQAVTMTVTWNTTTSNLVNPLSVAQLAQPALAAYVNALPVTAPMNLFELQTTFQEAISSVLTPALLTRMEFQIAINAVDTPPLSGTGIIEGDPEGYFTISATDVTVVQG